MILPVHILAGALALVFGYAALAVTKGAPWHRRAGMGFVVAMIVMSLSGALVAAFNGDRGSMIAGSLTFYFVATGLLTVRPIGNTRRIGSGLMIAAIILGLFAIWAGSWLAQRGRPEAAPMFLFSAMSLLGAFGDWKLLRHGALTGKPRLKRHLWRLCFAMWVAAASFFWGPPNRVPELIRIPMLLPIPVLVPVVVMFVWLWRLRARSAKPKVVLSSASTAEMMS